jgi:hypothetical protein
VLAAGWEGEGDAGGGPLKTVADVGTIETDDRSSKPYKVTFNSTSWWYKEGALAMHTTAAAKPVLLMYECVDPNDVGYVCAFSKPVYCRRI